MEYIKPDALVVLFDNDIITESNGDVYDEEGQE